MMPKFSNILALIFAFIIVFFLVFIVKKEQKYNKAYNEAYSSCKENIEDVNHLCECDSIFGFKECDTLNFAGIVFAGVNCCEREKYERFYIKKTAITNTPYAIKLNSHRDWDKIHFCLIENFDIEDFEWGAYEYKKIPERLKDYVVNKKWAIGKKNGKEYFVSWCVQTLSSGGLTMRFQEITIVITDLNLIKLYEKEQYEADAPKRKEHQKKLDEIKNNFPI